MLAARAPSAAERQAAAAVPAFGFGRARSAARGAEASPARQAPPGGAPAASAPPAGADPHPYSAHRLVSRRYIDAADAARAGAAARARLSAGRVAALQRLPFVGCSLCCARARHAEAERSGTRQVGLLDVHRSRGSRRPGSRRGAAGDAARTTTVHVDRDRDRDRFYARPVPDPILRVRLDCFPTVTTEPWAALLYCKAIGET